MPTVAASKKPSGGFFSDVKCSVSSFPHHVRIKVSCVHWGIVTPNTSLQLPLHLSFLGGFALSSVATYFCCMDLLITSTQAQLSPFQDFCKLENSRNAGSGVTLLGGIPGFAPSLTGVLFTIRS